MRIVIVSLLLSFAFFLQSIESSVNVDPNNYFHNNPVEPGTFRHHYQRPSRFDPVGPRPPFNPDTIRNYTPIRQLYPLPLPPGRRGRARPYQSNSDPEDIKQLLNSASHLDQSNPPARRLSKTKSKGGSLLCCGGF